MTLNELRPLTVLTHQEDLSDGSPVWVATCPELGITTQGFDLKHAQDMLREAIEGFLAVASDSEIQECLARGYTPQLAPLELAA